MNQTEKRDMIFDVLRIASLDRLPGAVVRHDEIADGYLKLCRLGREIHTAAERLCSDERYSQDLFDAKRDSVQRRAMRAINDSLCLLSPIACPNDERAYRLETGGDPRGSCLKLHCQGFTFCF